VWVKLISQCPLVKSERAFAAALGSLPRVSKEKEMACARREGEMVCFQDERMFVLQKRIQIQCLSR